MIKIVVVKMKTESKNSSLETIYQSENGALEIRLDGKNETIWANLNQIAMLFGKDKSVISRHIKNIFETKELEERETVAFFATVQMEGEKVVSRNIAFYNLDLVLSVGYRVNSKNATKFRQWATRTLKQYIVKGWSINRDKIKENYDEFLRAIEDLKKVLPSDKKLIENDNIIELIKIFANTWFSLDAYDKNTLSSIGKTKEEIMLTGNDLENDLNSLKKALINKNEATELFATEREKDNLKGIFGNIMQTFMGKDVYKTAEEKAVNLLYFIVKNHPFIDGNKRSGAYSFIWFLRKNKILDINKINPQALTAITILIAESNPKDREKIIKLILQLLR